MVSNADVARTLHETAATRLRSRGDDARRMPLFRVDDATRAADATEDDVIAVDTAPAAATTEV